MKRYHASLWSWKWGFNSPHPPKKGNLKKYMERKLQISIVEAQARFERWASEDIPIVIDPESLEIGSYKDRDLPGLTELYVNAFNSQNKRKYANISNAILAWDEEPWNLNSARNQLLEELNAPERICLVAQANSVNSKRKSVGFILARLVNFELLSKICGSAPTAKEIFVMADGPEKSLLLWEDAAVSNLRTSENKTIRGIGKSLYRRMAGEADRLGIVSIGRTAPGSFAEKILPTVGFVNPEPKIADGKDKSRYWLLRFSESR